MCTPPSSSPGSTGWPQRIARRSEPMMLPRALEDDLGLVLVDASWGRIQPFELASGVRTVGELEVIAHLKAGLALIDSRRPEQFAKATIRGARSLPHTELPARIGELDPARPAIFFCNGPQCAATPAAVGILLAAGYPASGILYYRGGLHDWITLGLPTVPGDRQRSASPSAMRPHAARWMQSAREPRAVLGKGGGRSKGETDGRDRVVRS